jgi:hypothetical protein
MSDLPDSLISQIADKLHVYSTALFRLWFDDQGVRRGQPFGSGTFVFIEGTYGVLTAQHVVDRLSDPYTLGLSVAREDEEHAMSVERNSLRIVEVAKPELEEYGPDLGFIVLTDWDNVTTIKASKLFHPLDLDKDELLNCPPPLDVGIWYFCGAPEERMVEEASERGFLGIMSFQDLCLAGGPSMTCKRGDYDYFDFDADENAQRPISYAGMSGGGLWQVTLGQSEGGALIPSRYLFSGVSFYQGVRSNGTRYMRCHGRRSVYEHVLRAVMK